MNEMTNVQNYDFLIKTLRKCGKQSPDRCWDCEYYDREPWCESALANDAADALEAAYKRIAELKSSALFAMCISQWLPDGAWMLTLTTARIAARG